MCVTLRVNTGRLRLVIMFVRLMMLLCPTMAVGLFGLRLVKFVMDHLTVVRFEFPALKRPSARKRIERALTILAVLFLGFLL